ncbi:hypothetical protein, partial [Streptomyces sp. URMC 123]|uniref:hypothetical protein n=1 Tax=Streptomyces sp. URMC 123 TaxID=3423403 RepID=UPI003F1978AD
MLVAAAVCPCPPLLVPEVAAGAAAELDALRAACSDAVSVLAAARPDRLVVIGPAEQDGRGPHPGGAIGSFHGFGVDVRTPLDPSRAEAPAAADAAAERATERLLPPSLAVAAWLLREAGWSAAPVEGLGVGEPLSSDHCAEVGHDLAAGAERVALLVMGEGSACRMLRLPDCPLEAAA